MSFRQSRRTPALTALLTLLSFLATLFPTRLARADLGSLTAPIPLGSGGPGSLTLPTPPADAADTQATIDLSTGAAKTTFTFDLPTARGKAQPTLSLEYSSASGPGMGGMGWSFNLPSIVRKGASGLPSFVDEVISSPSNISNTADDYYADGALLVPICPLVANGNAATCGAGGHLVTGEVLPTSFGPAPSAGYVYFRREVDDGNRYFLSPDGQTWVMQTKAGHLLQFGHPLDGMFITTQSTGENFVDGSEKPNTFTVQAAVGGQVGAAYRWNLVRDTDSTGNNTVYYAWTDNHYQLPNATLPDLHYLSDIYDTPPPGSTPASLSTPAFAHHVHLTWGPLVNGSPLVANDFDAIWRAVPRFSLQNVDVTSASFLSPNRQFVRRYQLGYQANASASRIFLTNINVEGTCPSAVLEGAGGLVSPPLTCPTLSLVQYAYTPDAALNSPPTQSTSTIAFDTQNTPNSLFDVNGDGVPDVVFNDTVFPGAINQAAVVSLGPWPYSASTQFAVTSLAPAQSGPSPTLGNILPGSNQLVLGDWLSNGVLNWLWLDPATNPFVEPSGQSVFPPGFVGYSLQVASLGQGQLAGSFVGGAGLTGGQCALLGGCQSGYGLDADGDGLTDMTLVPANASQSTYLTTRDHFGYIAPFSTGLSGAVLYNQLDPASYGNNAFRVFADADGDGLPDLVIIAQAPSGALTLAVFINRGDGRYGSDSNGTFTGNPILTSPGNIIGSGSINVAFTGMGDLNGDGIADLAVLGEDGLHVCMLGGMAQIAVPINCTTVSGLTSVGANNLAIVDVFGQGVSQVVILGEFGFNEPIQPFGTAVSFAPATRPGLLNTITRLGGQQTAIQYKASTSLPGVQMPVVQWVATAITTTNQLSGNAARSVTKTYTYQNAQYDARDRQFVGFQTVTESTSGNASAAPGLVGTTSFATTTCPTTATGNACTGTIDYGGYRMLRGLPVVVEENDQNGVFLQTTANQYNVLTLYTGLDRRVVRRVPLSGKQTYLWSPNSQAPVSKGFQILTNPGLGPVSAPPSVFGVVPASGGVVLTKERTEDNFGNETVAIDLGSTGGGVPDTPIRVEHDWALPGGDTTGWSYRATAERTGSSSSTPLVPGPSIRSYGFRYNSVGLLTTVTGVLIGTQSLPGPNGGSRAAGGAPNVSSDNPSLTLATFSYDPYGNLQQAQGPASLTRCTLTTYDNSFNQLPTSRTASPNGCSTPASSSSGLTTAFIWDRGLERVTTQAGPAMAGFAAPTTTMTYDPFGRVLQIFEPSDVVVGMTDQNPALTAPTLNGLTGVQYFDAGPIRAVHFQTIDGDESSPFYVDHYRYFDGFGTMLASMDNAAAQGATPQWRVSGVHTVFPNGLTASTFAPFYYANAGTGPFDFFNASTYGSGAGPAGSTTPAQFQYDGLGRVLRRTDFLGQPSTSTYQFGGSGGAIAVAAQDPEQLNPNGPQAGSSTTRFFDGHGRAIGGNAHLTNTANGLVDVTSSATYLPTGELTTFSQTNPGGQPYSRTVTYDSLGRMVQNSEPNTGTWTYAYDDAGELVGTSDARGCGLNVYRDGLGRVTTQDYSPCTSSQPPYSRANPATGAGAEGFFTYDAYGRLAKAYDRSEFSTYFYDGRGRLTKTQRRIVPPAGIPTFSLSTTTRGTGTSSMDIAGAVTDASGNPLANATVTLTGSSQASVQTNINGAYVFPSLSPGGTYTVYVSNSPSGCSFIPNVENGVKPGQTANFQGNGGQCGPLVSTPIVPRGSLSISGVVAASDGTGIPGIQMTLNGSLQAITTTDSGGAYAFDGLAPNSYTLGVGALPAGCAVSPLGNSNLNFNNITSNVVQNFAASGGCEPASGGVSSLGGGLDDNYAPHVFTKTFSYYESNRVAEEGTGGDLPDLLVGGIGSPGGGSSVFLSYLQQGTLNGVGSNYGTLISSQVVDALGNATNIQFGDAAQTQATMGFDNNETLRSFGVSRSPGTFASGAWVNYANGTAPGPQQANGPDNTLQVNLASITITPDGVGNPLTLTDSADPSVWPAGAGPTAATQFSYWSDYRIKQASEQYAAPNGAFTPAYTAEELSSGLYTERTNAIGSSAPLLTRVGNQTFSYDGRGNITSSTDDQNDFFDRSLGTVPYATADQMGGAILESIDPQTNHATIQYDAAGHITQVFNNSTLDTYQYAWDEVGQLTSAARSNASDGLGVTEQFAYDSAGGRVVTARQLATNGSPDYTVQVFGSLVLEHAAFPGSPGDYERDLKTEQLYLTGAGQVFGHVFYDWEKSLPAASSGHGQLHIFMPLGDRLGSTTFVIDHDTGEVVERAAYQSYGAVDSDYRPARWGNFREDLRYTGHWDNSEVGLIYFGGRYYSPQLGRWLSADPLTLHGLRGDSNPYAYVGGSPTRNVDPLGLAPGGTACVTTDSGDYCESFDPTDDLEGAAAAAAAEVAAVEEESALVAGEVASNYPVAIAPLAAANDNALALVGGVSAGGLGIGLAGGIGAAGLAYELGPTVTQSWENNATLFGPYVGGAFNGTPADETADEGGAPIPVPAAGGAGGGNELPPRGPSATQGLANLVQGSVPRKAQTVALLETVEGPTLVTTGGQPLTPEQIQLAEAHGLTVVDPIPGLDAEQALTQRAVWSQVTPTNGVATNNVCAGRCAPLIYELGGWVSGQYFGF